MSAIASFTKLPKASLDGLRQAPAQGGFNKFLQQHGEPVADYEWSGYVLATLLPYLDEQQIHLMKSEHDELSTFLSQTLQASCFILTDAHRQAYANRLAPQSFSEQTLRDYYNEFNGTDEADAGQPMLERHSGLPAEFERSRCGFCDCVLYHMSLLTTAASKSTRRRRVRFRLKG